MANILINGFDFSKYQGNPDFDKIKASGKAKFIMLRAISTNHDGIYIDPTFDRNYAECKRVGIPCGAYMYTYATTKDIATAEVNMFKKAIEGKQFEYPLAVDVEDNSLRPISKQALTDLVLYELKTIESWGYFVQVYTYVSYAHSEIDMDQLKHFDTWIANFSSKCSYDGVYGMWQNSSSGTIEGVSGHVDTDIAYRDYEAEIKNAKLNGWDKPVVAPPKPIVIAPIEIPNQTPYHDGDKVVVVNAINYDTHGTFNASYHPVYEVIGTPKYKRVVIGVNGVVTVAINSDNLKSYVANVPAPTPAPTPTPSKPSYKPVDADIVARVKRGDFGNGNEHRRPLIEALGYNYEEVRAAINGNTNVSSSSTQTSTRTYTIQKGDSFCKISRKMYGTESKAFQIASANGMSLNSIIYAGKELIIP